MTTARRLLLLPLLLVAALVLASCGGDAEQAGGDSTSSGADHNQADVDFATTMIPHHAQALSMVDLTVGHELSPKVVQLADEVRATQAAEIEQLSDWLVEWGEPVPETVRDHANAHGDSHGGAEGEMAEMPGMMGEQEMTALAQAPDARFEALFLDMMIEHHEGAVEMARAEQRDGTHAPSVELARRIEREQTEQVELMRSLR